MQPLVSQKTSVWTCPMDALIPICLCVCVYRVGRRISCHQLVSGAGHTPGQPTVRPVESYSWRLSVGLCSTGHMGNLWQGLGSPQDPPWQPPWLLPLVSPSCQLKSWKCFFFMTWKTEKFYARCHLSEVFLKPHLDRGSECSERTLVLNLTCKAGGESCVLSRHHPVVMSLKTRVSIIHDVCSQSRHALLAAQWFWSHLNGRCSEEVFPQDIYIPPSHSQMKDVNLVKRCSAG